MDAYYVVYRAKTGDMRMIKKANYGAAQARWRKLISRGYSDVSIQRA